MGSEVTNIRDLDTSDRVKVTNIRGLDTSWAVHRVKVTNITDLDTSGHCIKSRLLTSEVLHLLDSGFPRNQ
jgi:hypothetical protein